MQLEPAEDFEASGGRYMGVKEGRVDNGWGNKRAISQVQSVL